MQADRGALASAAATVQDLLARTDASPLRARGLVVLGDLLVVQGELDAARCALTEALALIEGLGEDYLGEMWSYERDRAIELLAELE